MMMKSTSRLQSGSVLPRNAMIALAGTVALWAWKNFRRKPGTLNPAEPASNRRAFGIAGAIGSAVEEGARRVREQAAKRTATSPDQHRAS
ncbi:MAG: hypothetical protein ABIO65_05370 [Nitrospiria bacterium]